MNNDPHNVDQPPDTPREVIQAWRFAGKLPPPRACSVDAPDEYVFEASDDDSEKEDSHHG